MFQRVSKVKSVTATSLLFSSTLQIGDCSYIDGRANVMAVHRNMEITLLRGNQFSDYPIYSKPIPLPILDEPLLTHFENPCPIIKVDHINIIGATVSAYAGIGNVGHIRMDARVKNIRNLLPGTFESLQTEE